MNHDHFLRLLSARGPREMRGQQGSGFLKRSGLAVLGGLPILGTRSNSVLQFFNQIKKRRSRREDQEEKIKKRILRREDREERKGKKEERKEGCFLLETHDDKGLDETDKLGFPSREVLVDLFIASRGLCTLLARICSDLLLDCRDESVEKVTDPVAVLEVSQLLSNGVFVWIAFHYCESLGPFQLMRREEKKRGGRRGGRRERR